MSDLGGTISDAILFKLGVKIKRLALNFIF